MCRFKSLCRLNVFVHILHWNLDGSDSGRSGGSFSVAAFTSGVSSGPDIGFLIPCPPLMISIGISAGIPS